MVPNKSYALNSKNYYFRAFELMALLKKDNNSDKKKAFDILLKNKGKEVRTADIKKECGFKDEEFNRAINFLIYHSIAKKMGRGKYSLIGNGLDLFDKKWRIIDDIRDYGEDIFNYPTKKSSLQIVLFGLNDTDIDSEINNLVDKVEELYLTVIKKKYSAFSNEIKKNLTGIKLNATLRFLKSIDYNIYLNLIGDFAKERYNHDREANMLQLTVLIGRIFAEKKRLKKFEELDKEEQIKVIRYIYELTKYFNILQTAVYIKFYGLNTNPLPKFTKNKETIKDGRKLINNIYKFIYNNQSDIFR